MTNEANNNSNDITIGEKTFTFAGYDNGQPLYSCNGKTYTKREVAQIIGLYMIENPDKDLNQ